MINLNYLLATLCLAAIANCNPCTSKGCGEVCIYDGKTNARCACSCSSILVDKLQCVKSPGQETIPTVFDSNNARKQLGVKIPTCRLMTMTCADLKINDYNDDVCSFSQTVSDGLLVQIPIMTANTVIEVQPDKVKVTNSIVPAVGDGKAYPQIEFAVEKDFAVKKFEYSYTASLSRVDPDGEFFGTEMKFYSDDKLQHEITAATEYKIEIGTSLYLAVNSNSLPDGVTAKIRTSTASELNSEDKHIQFDKGKPFWCEPICGITYDKNNFVIKDRMFEVGRTALKEDSQKAPIQYQVEFAQCVTGESHKYCKKSKKVVKVNIARKKRSLPDENTKNILQNYLDAEIEQISFMNMEEDVKQPQGITMGTNILFLIIFALVVNYLIPNKTEGRSPSKRSTLVK